MRRRQPCRSGSRSGRGSGARAAIAVGLPVLLLAALGAPARGELSPMRVIEGQLVKPDLLVVIDTSGSMDWTAADYDDAGQDCNKDEGPAVSGVTADIAVDQLGDGLCSGRETSSTDCIGLTNDAGPGSPRQCRGSGTTGASRAYQTKRVLRALLPEIGPAANFGLVTFKDTGYFQYYEAQQDCVCDPCPGTVVTCSSTTCKADQVTCPSDYNFYGWSSSRCRCRKRSGWSWVYADAVQCTGPPTAAVCSSSSGPPNCLTDCKCHSGSGPLRRCSQGSDPCCSCPSPSSDWNISCSDQDPTDCATSGGCVCSKRRERTTPSSDCGCNCDHLSGYALRDICKRSNLSRRDWNSCMHRGCYKGPWWRPSYRAPQCNDPCPPSQAASCEPGCPGTPSSTITDASCTAPAQKATTFFLSEIELKALNMWNGATDAPVAVCDPAAEACGWRDSSDPPAWHAARMTLLSQVDNSSGSGYETISSAVKTRDSLYRCSTDLTRQRRWQFSVKGKAHATQVDGCSSWEYLGSYYTYLQRQMKSPQNTAYGCGSADCHIEATWRGPQYVEDGVPHVYRRLFAGKPPYAGDWEYTQGFDWASDGMVLVPLEPMPTTEAQAAVIGAIAPWLNHSTSGGLFFYGGTPTGPALKTAGDHFVARQEGTSPFEADDQDHFAVCRPRFALLLSDGQSGAGDKPEYVARRLYQGGNLSSNYPNWNKLTKYSGQPDNPIKTLVVGIPGLPSSARAELHRTAKSGADGTDCSGGCASHVSYCNAQIAGGNVPEGCAYISQDETALAEDIRKVVYDLVAGDYTTAAVGVASTNSSQHVGNLAIVPSTTYPGWRGQLRAFDLSAQGDPVAQWDAGQKLASLANDCHDKRPLYTGHPGTSNGAAIPLFDPNAGYSVNVAQILAAVSAAGASLPAEATENENARLKEMIAWLAGKDRDWRLGPVFQCTPATVGDPPEHSQLVLEGRAPLVYVTSNDGWLHAFRVADGTEAFSYIPPSALPRVYELWKIGGQPESPTEFRWIMASSPRVDDVPTDGAGGDWRTHLYLTMGPGGNEVVTLDVTNPVTCADSPPSPLPACYRPCSITGDFLKVVGYSHGTGAPVAGSTPISDRLGRTWSLPAIFYDSNRHKSGIAMGSGYPLAPSGSPQGDYYFSLMAPFTSYGSTEHVDPAGTGTVDYAVLADGVAETDDQGRIVATYQADLGGRIIRYPDGTALGSPVGATFCSTSPDRCVVDDGTSHPFYYSPAVYQGDTATYVAALSGSSREQVSTATQEAKIYVLKLEGAARNTLAEFRIDQLCDQFEEEAKPADCTSIAPAVRARPVGSPIIIDNAIEGAATRIEVFALYYEPPAEDDPCHPGYSYTLRFAVDLANPDKKLISIDRDEGLAGGMTIVGGGTNVAVVLSGAGDEAAKVKKIIDEDLPQAPTLGPGKATVETWKEVRF